MKDATWVKALIGLPVEITIPEWLAREHHLPTHAHGRIRVVTAKALGFDPFDDGTIIWLPVSQVVWIDRIKDLA